MTTGDALPLIPKIYYRQLIRCDGPDIRDFVRLFIHPPRHERLCTGTKQRPLRGHRDAAYETSASVHQSRANACAAALLE
ncbi:MAG: hypothetical protein ACI915_003952 [Gammaproteobacteria bacterium]|jgi:hypothetical protein